MIKVNVDPEYETDKSIEMFSLLSPASDSRSWTFSLHVFLSFLYPLSYPASVFFDQLTFSYDFSNLCFCLNTSANKRGDHEVKFATTKKTNSSPVSHAQSPRAEWKNAGSRN